MRNFWKLMYCVWGKFETNKGHAAGRWFLFREFVHHAGAICTIVLLIPFCFDIRINASYIMFTIIKTLQYIRCRMRNTHCSHKIWIFLKILDGLQANGHLLREMFSRKRIKNIIQLCIDWCLIDRFAKMHQLLAK